MRGRGVRQQVGVLLTALALTVGPGSAQVRQ